MIESNNDPFYTFLKSNSNAWIPYSNIVIDCLSTYLNHFLKIYSSGADNRLNSLRCDQYSTISEDLINELLEIAVDSGDNAAEFSLLAIDHARQLAEKLEYETIVYIDIDFLNAADYIAQEYEIKSSRSSEDLIASTEIMSAFHIIRKNFMVTFNSNEKSDFSYISEVFKYSLKKFLN